MKETPPRGGLVEEDPPRPVASRIPGTHPALNYCVYCFEPYYDGGWHFCRTYRCPPLSNRPPEADVQRALEVAKWMAS